MRRSAAQGFAVAVTFATLAAVASCGSATSSGNTSTASTSPSPRSGPIGVVLPGTQLQGAAQVLGPVRQVRVGEIGIGYRQFGTGPDLLMVVGDTAPMSLWTLDLLQQLSPRFRVTIFDNRGVGYTTDDPSTPLTVPQMANDTAGLIGALHLDQPTLLGWSMGGEIGLSVAVQHPGAIKRLVTTGGDYGGPEAIQPQAQILQELNDPNTTPEQYLNLVFPPSAAAAKAAFVHQYTLVPQEQISSQTLVRQGQAEAAWYRYSGTYDGLSRVRIPLLVTNGAEDIVNPSANAQLIAGRVPRARVQLFPGAGHAMLFQDSSAFVRSVVSFVGP